MMRIILSFSLLFYPILSFAVGCDRIWFHVAGVSKHIEVFEPTQYTRYKRQTHPGFGVECQKKNVTLALGEFVNSLNKPFQYATATKDFVKYGNFKLFAGMLVGEYGRTEREPLKVISPVAYVEYQYQYIGLNMFVLPPSKGINDYAIFYTQFKIHF